MFGDIVNNEMRLNEYGDIASKCWTEMAEHFPNVNIDEYVIMPNHMHGIIIIGDMNDAAGAGSPCPVAKTIGREQIKTGQEQITIGRGDPAPTGDPTENDMVL
jgi:hypothetical protein